MSGNNTFDDYDYSQYYNGNDSDVAPCSNKEMREFGKVFLPVLYTSVFIIGVIGNGLVVCVLVRHRNQTNLTDICLFNLALSDLLFVLTLPFYANYAAVGSWTFRDFLCHFIGGSHNVGFLSSIFFMVVMTLDRYMTIIHWRKIANYRTVKMGLALSMVIWILSFCISLPNYVFTMVKNESNHLSCAYNPENKAWNVFNVFATNILGLVFPLLVMVACYSRIVPAVLKIRSAKKYRVVKLTISIVVVFFLFWAPYNISFFLRFLQHNGVIMLNDDCHSDTNLRLSITVTETIAMTHCCLNPIIYAFVGQKFMKRVVQLLRKWLPGIQLLSTADLSDSTFRKSSVMSRSSDVTTFSHIG
ncbi:C-C chemokine receptor type 5 [Scomber scombrus]|uniref:C-C chemokine receptor type 5 n=1 Tax=Scomber scombrus TaxID=13677 RepID=A0AAV1N4M6_SCOSC